MSLASPLAAWERQPGEPNLWFTRFDQYRLAGPGRSLLSLANAERAQRGKKPARSIPHAWTTQARQWRWQERAEAWDAYDRQQRFQQYETERQKDRDHRVKLLMALRAKLAQALQLLLPETAGWAEVANGVKMVTEQLRKEFGGEQPARHEENQPGDDIRLPVQQLTDDELTAIIRGGSAGTQA